MANRRFNTQVKKPGFLKGGQVKLDANKDGKISGKDFEIKKKKKKATSLKLPPIESERVRS